MGRREAYEGAWEGKILTVESSSGENSAGVWRHPMMTANSIRPTAQVGGPRREVCVYLEGGRRGRLGGTGTS